MLCMMRLLEHLLENMMQKQQMVLNDFHEEIMKMISTVILGTSMVFGVAWFHHHPQPSFSTRYPEQFYQFLPVLKEQSQTLCEQNQSAVSSLILSVQCTCFY